MITPLAINALTNPSNIQKIISSNNHSIAQKVGNAWQEKAIQSTEIINKNTLDNGLTEAEFLEANKLLTQLKVNDENGDTSAESHRNNFLMIYRKLINISKEERITLIANVQKILSASEPIDNKELLSNAFKRAIYRYYAIEAMNQPLLNQMNDQINSISLDGSDEEEEYNFY